MGSRGEELSSPSGALNDDEFSSHDSGDEELCSSEAGSQTKLQFRCAVLKASWNDETGMAEILNHKGNLLKSLGIDHSGKIYLSIEETLGHPPSVSDIKELERQSNGLPLKIGHVDDGRVGLFSFDKVELPALP